jgi:hypothetical protein
MTQLEFFSRHRLGETHSGRAIARKPNPATKEFAMDLFEAIQPVFQTERFDVFRVTCVRNPALGVPRTVYIAFHRHQDIPRPVCICTVLGKCPIDGLPYVEWLEVTSNDRRTGIATEVLLGVQDFIGPMIAEPVTHAGEKLVEALGDQLIDVPIETYREDAPAEATYWTNSGRTEE